MNQLVTPIPADIRERIIQAANDLYEQAGRQSFPTVDQVRRYARVDMNAASAIMREWRRAQSVQAAPVAVHVPDAMVKANHQVLVALWTQAQEMANESLKTAQSAWAEAERTELDDMRQELAYAYEAQAAERDAAKSELTRVLATAEAMAETQREQRNAATHELAKLTEQRDLALKSAAEAREYGAELAGKLSATQEQNAALLTRMMTSNDKTNTDKT
ncbi:MAG: DNA-binding protein [Methylomonas sp.]